MHHLSNDYSDFTLLNLGWNENGHGPYLVRQEGTPSPGSCPRPVTGKYVLLKDGTWLLNLKFCTLPEEEWRKHLFQDIKEVEAVVESLPNRPAIDCELPPDLNQEEMLARMANTAHAFLEKKRLRESRIRL